MSDEAEVGIANLALARLSKEPIASLTENNERAKMVRPLFPLIFRRFITAHDWSFSTAQARLNLLSLTKEQNLSAPFRNAFALPPDYLKMQAVFLNGCYPAPADSYRVMRYASNKSPALFTDAAGVEIRYTSSAALIADFSPAATDALSALLAVELTLNIENSTQRGELLIQRYQEAFKAAVRDDLKSGSVHKMGGHDYTAARISAASFGRG
jgi:hypothetical protein